MSERDIEVLRKAYEAFNRRDLDALIDFFDPEAHWVPSVSVWGAGTIYHGHDGLRELLSDLASDWERFEARPEDFHEVGDLILVIGRVRAIPTGGASEIDREAAWIWEMRDGKALLLQAYTDPASARESLGLGD